MRRPLKITLWVAGLLLLLPVLGWLFLISPPGRAMIAGIAGKAASSNGQTVIIGGIDGSLPFSPVVRDITIADADGVWLTLDRTAVAWKPGGLLAGRLTIDSIDMDRLAISRQPKIVPEPAKPDATDDSGGGFEIKLDALTLDRLELAAPVAGEAAVLSVDGAVDFRPARTAVTVAAKRIDKPGSLSAALDWQGPERQLAVKIHADEPPGGLAGRINRLDPQAGFRIDLDGAGALDDWRATLDLASGEATVKGAARLERQADGLKLTADMTGRLEALLPADRAPLVAGESRVEAAIRFPADGSVQIDTARLTAAAGSAGLTGSVGADRSLDIGYELTAIATPLSGLLPGGLSWQTLAAEGRVAGTADSPRATAAVTATGIASDQGGIETARIDLAVETTGRLADADARFAVSGGGTAGGIAATDARLAPLGRSLAFDIDGTAAMDRSFEAKRIALALDTGTLVWRGRLSAQGAKGELAVAAADLAPFSGLAGRPLTGTGTAHVIVEADAKGAVTADARAFGHGLNILPPPLNTVSARGRVTQIPGGGLMLEDGHVLAPGLTLDLSGSHGVAGGGPKGEGRLAIGEIARFDPRASGSLSAGFSLDRGVLKADVSMPRGTAQGRVMEDVRLLVEATGLPDAPNGAIRLSGRLDGRPITGGGTIGGTAGDIVVEGLDLAAGSVRLSGGLRIAGPLLTGRLQLAAGELADVAPLLLAPLSGALNATVDLAAPGGVQTVALAAEGRKLAYAESSAASVSVKAGLTDPLGAPAVDASVTASGIVAGGQRLDRLAATAKGGFSAADVTVKASGPLLSADGAARLAMSQGTVVIDLSRLLVTSKGIQARLSRPAKLTLAEGMVAIEQLALAIGGGSVTVSGRAGQALDLSIAVAGLPLSLAKTMAPAVDIAGTLSGKATIQGTPAAPRGSYDVAVKALTNPAMREAGVPALDVTARGTLEGDRTRLTATARNSRGLDLRASGTVPLSATGRIDLAVTGTGDLSLLNPALASGSRASGPVSLDLRVAGALPRPAASGRLELRGGRFANPYQGLAYTDIEMALVATATRVTIERLSARGQGGGTLTGGGAIDLDFAAGLPASLTLKADALRAVESERASATVDSDLRLSGPLLTTPSLSGTVNIRNAEINLPEQRAMAVAALPVEHRNAPPAIADQLERERARRNPQKGSGLVVALDVTVDGGNRITVRGMGLDATLGGEVRVRGTSAAIRPEGAFTLRRGRFTLLGTTLNLVRGRVTLLGDMDAGLDFAAEAISEGFIARVLVGGMVSKPVISFESSPALPQDEVISRLLFDKATGALTTGEAVRLAQAVSGLLGTGSAGGGIIDDLRKSLGVDALDIDAEQVGIGSYLNDNTYVDFSQGAAPGTGQVTVDIEVTDEIKARGGVSSNGSSSVGLAVEWEY